MYYDAAGRPVKTVNPDGSEQRVIYGKPKTIGTPSDFVPSPWEKYSYDQNGNKIQPKCGRTNLTLWKLNNY